jgi:hypothetical protein
LDKPLHVIYKVSKLAYRIWVILIANERVKKNPFRVRRLREINLDIMNNTWTEIVIFELWQVMNRTETTWISTLTNFTCFVLFTNILSSSASTKIILRPGRPKGRNSIPGRDNKLFFSLQRCSLSLLYNVYRRLHITLLYLLLTSWSGPNIEHRSDHCKTPFSVARCLLSRIIATERYCSAYALPWECCT